MYVSEYVYLPMSGGIRRVSRVMVLNFVLSYLSGFSFWRYIIDYCQVYYSGLCHYSSNVVVLCPLCF